MLYIHGATILTPHQRIDGGALLIESGRISAMGAVDDVMCPSGSQVIDTDGLLLAPGFVDLQINGAFGHDFTDDPASIWTVGRQLPRYGVTSFLPTIITAPLATVTAAQAIVNQGPPTDYVGATSLGLHIEGPFLNSNKRGAHNADYLQLPQLESIRDWSPGKGIRLVTLAPELPGALDVIATLTERGVVVSAGHSMASYAEARDGLAAGIRYGTHLFNAMPPLHHREPGLTGALLADDNVTIGIIADGIHVHPAMVRFIWQVVGNQRLTLVSDAMAALGMPPGRYTLGDFEVLVAENSVRLPDGTLAGSVLSLDVAVRNLMHFTDCTIESALATVTATPAKVLGLSNQIGHLTPGSMADLVLLTPDLTVATTIIRGEVVYTNEALF